MRIIVYIVLLLQPLVFAGVAIAEYCEVTLLGTGTPRPSIQRFGPATLVSAGGKYFLFDAGRGATIRLQQAGISPNLIDQVFLTHLHSDHVSGLDDLWITGWVWQRQQNLKVFGPQGTDQLVQGLRDAYSPDIAYRHANSGLDDEKAHIESKEIEEGIIYKNAGVTIRAFLVDHKPVEPAFGYRIEFGERVIIISGDTTYTDTVVEQASDADVLIHEIAAANESLLKKNKRLQKIIGYHTNPAQMAQILKKSGPRFAVLTHVLLFGESENTVLETIRSEYQGEVLMGHDLMKIGVGEKITVTKIAPEQYE